MAALMAVNLAAAEQAVAGKSFRRSPDEDVPRFFRKKGQYPSQAEVKAALALYGIGFVRDDSGFYRPAARPDPRTHGRPDARGDLPRQLRLNFSEVHKDQ